MRHPESEAIVSELYYAALSGVSWDRAAQRLQAVTSRPVTVALRVVGADGRELIAGQAGLPGEALIEYRDYYASINPYTPVLADLPSRRPATVRDLGFDLVHLSETEFNKDFLTRYDVGPAGVGMKMVDGGDGFMVLGVNYDDSHSPSLDPLFKSLCLELSEHIAHAVTIAEQQVVDARRSGAMATLSTLPTPALVLNERGRVIGSNRPAEELLASGVVLVDRNRRLRSRVPTVDDELTHAVDHAMPPHRRTAILRVPDFGTTGDVIVSIVPLPDDPSGPTHWSQLLEDRFPVAIAYLSRDMRPAAIVEHLRGLYELDVVEARAAYAIYCGLTLSQFAADEGLNLYEASLLQDRVLQRFGAHRNADIARRVGVVAHLTGPASLSVQHPGDKG